MTETSARTLSVWIVNYNSLEYLTSCLTGLDSRLIREIVVLDNASNSDERRGLESLAESDDRILLILADDNLGFGAGHHRIGDRTAHGRRPGDLIWILNPDTIVSSAAVERLCGIVSGGDADIVSPVLLTGEQAKPVIWFAGGDIDIRKGRVTHRGAGESPESNPTGDLVATGFISGAAAMMSRATWDRLGGFRTDLFLYWEDVDLSLRATQAGMRLAVAPDAVIWHAEGGSTSNRAGVSPTTYYYSARNRVIVCSAFGNAIGLALGRGFPFLLRLSATAFLKGRQRRLAKLLAVVRGTLDGLRGRTGARR